MIAEHTGLGGGKAADKSDVDTTDATTDMTHKISGGAFRGAPVENSTCDLWRLSARSSAKMSVKYAWGSKDL